MNIYKQELKQYRNTLIGWCIAYICILALYLSFLPAFLDEGGGMRDYFASLPPEFMAAFGLDISLFFGPLGFITFVMTMFVLLVGIQAVHMGLSIYGKEQRNRTSDFLLSKPVKRAKIFWSKFLAGLTALFISEVVIYSAGYFIIKMVSDAAFPMNTYLLLLATCTFVQLVFFALGTLLSVLLKRIKNIVGLATGVGMGFFVIRMIANISNATTLRWINPYQFFDNMYVVAYNRYESASILVSLGVFVVLEAVSLWIYQHMDIHAV
ncbi:MAG: ABC transporter permease [Erysipelotrichaceae bacterium]|jgi:ABC-2 type transport system permease protein|nr:ABC transporter permease [Erysipelotrichaceae bacterium]